MKAKIRKIYTYFFNIISNELSTCKKDKATKNDTTIDEIRRQSTKNSCDVLLFSYYERHRNKYIEVIRKDKEKYYSQKYDSNLRILWKILKEITYTNKFGQRKQINILQI